MSGRAEPTAPFFYGTKIVPFFVSGADRLPASGATILPNRTIRRGATDRGRCGFRLFSQYKGRDFSTISLPFSPKRPDFRTNRRPERSVGRLEGPLGVHFGNFFAFFVRFVLEKKIYLYICSPETQVTGTTLERCRSGRSGRTRNAVYGQLYRGFESLSLRRIA